VRRPAAVVTVSALLDALQVALDVVAGLLAPDAAALRDGLPGVTDRLLVQVLVFGTGAQARYRVLAVAAVLPARRGQVPAPAAVAVLAGVAGIASP
jgi:hypothetical protein